ncbi:MAG: AbrB/MazE/SpoVT family DNA-binding domain-containing protein [Clostridia bacterium]
MLVSVIQIGNSRGIRLPKAILDQLKVSEKLELEVENQQIILKPLQDQPRQGWAEEFRKMASLQEDRLLISENSGMDGFEWEW